MRFLLAAALSVCAVTSQAQVYRAHVVDINSHRPLNDVVILNLNTKMAAVTEANGSFTINGRPGDQLRFVHPGFADHFSYVTTRFTDTIFMLEGSVTLQEVTVTSELARFRKDSADRHIIYKRILEDANSKPRVGTVNGGPNNFGVAVGGLFSELALRASGKKKAYRKFEKQMLQDEQERFIAIRYNPDLVMRTTGMDQTASEAFVRTHVMPIEFARQASDLEIKMWIRERWRRDQPKN